MSKPQVQSLHLYPVKALAGTGPGEAAVEPWGLAGDRRWLVADAEGRQLTQRQVPRLALARAEGLPGGALRLTAPGMVPLTVPVPAPVGTVPVQVFGGVVEAVPAGPEAADWWRRYLGAECRMVHLDAPERRRPIDPRFSEPGDTVSFADGFPLLLTTTASLDALNSLIAQGGHAAEGPLPMNRFRPNVVIAGTAPWAEDDWRRVRIGAVEFQVAKPSSRCVVTTTDQRTAERGKEPLRTLALHRRFGEKLVFGQNLIPRGSGTLRVGDPFEILA
ncbi:molybdenum cofactor biosysynthesis protein [Streptomyces sp. NRRL F-4489]|uniref:MOSC domain-containing protein n=1 Tax=Streptomyces sp. NRRL F-4489 TaxID=1609095 RepID=UPI000747D437|nr:MOSC N-terminal beta barrel domain-containing protein [Streptomyces sp. NRRL F-4489]KUL52253.1 molybdenum cofactor biosysynthesis protein [Streptomyces sp. NRRL F-4489]